ncbi:hypothetical protein DY000_02013287 [Brassica cretica]|uniref:Uncharacterized protein n=1 Tax=Brassica cretica TaxID=69181 RepID=A0ABQ7CYK0_BRACR|nr:hypothetical protein DY000_02013287 [Brassica cretica]
MAKKKKTQPSSSGGNPTGSTDSSASSHSIATKSAGLAPSSPPLSKTNELPGDSISPANTHTVDLQIQSGYDVSSIPMDLVNPNSKIAATTTDVPAQEALNQIADESSLPLPLPIGTPSGDNANLEQEKVTEAAKFWKAKHKTEDCPRSNTAPPKSSVPKAKVKAANIAKENAKEKAVAISCELVRDKVPVVIDEPVQKKRLPIPTEKRHLLLQNKDSKGRFLQRCNQINSTLPHPVPQLDPFRFCSLVFLRAGRQPLLLL